MAQLDKLLAHAASRGALALRLEPGQQPILETHSGAQPLLPQALPPTMLELLASEVLPSHLESTWQSRGEVHFDYDSGLHCFALALQRTPGGIRIEARPIANAEPQSGSLELTVPSPRTMPSMGSPGSSGIELNEDRAEITTRAQPVQLSPTPAPITAVPVSTRATEPGSHPLATQLFQALIDHKGSDLHLSAFEMPISRIHGDLEDLVEFGILGPSQILSMMEAIATPTAWQQFQQTRDADFAYAFEPGNCRLRVNFFEDRVGPGLVCRVIPNQIPDPDQLGLAEPIRRLADLAKGLVLVTGPTGSGKSTTLAAILDLANQHRSDHILTIEDPIEFVHPRKKCLINQREVGTHTASFKSGLRAALREDPDIVMVGEMRDLETIAIALETAITGHLVFGTLHTNSAVGTIDRIVDQFPADRQSQIRVMLADSLKASISQTLLKKIGGGRVAAIESLFITPAIANLIREGKNFQIPSAMQTGRAYGQRLMNDALVELIQAGTVEPMEAYTKCADKEAFMATLKRANINWDPRGEERPIPL